MPKRHLRYHGFQRLEIFGFCQHTGNHKSIYINPHSWLFWRMGLQSAKDAFHYLSTEDQAFILSGEPPDQWEDHL